MLGNGTDTIVMNVSSPSHVEVEPNVFPSISGVVLPETGLSESGSIYHVHMATPTPGVGVSPIDAIDNRHHGNLEAAFNSRLSYCLEAAFNSRLTYWLEAAFNSRLTYW